MKMKCKINDSLIEVEFSHDNLVTRLDPERATSSFLSGQTQIPLICRDKLAEQLIERINALSLPSNNLSIEIIDDADEVLDKKAKDEVLSAVLDLVRKFKVKNAVTLPKSYMEDWSLRKIGRINYSIHRNLAPKHYGAADWLQLKPFKQEYLNICELLGGEKDPIGALECQPQWRDPEHQAAFDAGEKAAKSTKEYLKSWFNKDALKHPIWFGQGMRRGQRLVGNENNRAHIKVKM